jgi:hypothetical protein
VSLHPAPPPAPAEEDPPPELLRIIQGLARMNARRDYAAQQQASQEPRPDAA